MGGFLKQHFHKYWPFYLIIGILFIVNGNQIINNHSLMVFNTDSYSQSLQFYLGGWEKFRQLDFSLWDWSSGYGANFLNHVYYFATSPFFYLTLLFDKILIPYLFLYLNAFKLLLIFTFSYMWLSQLVKEKWIITIGALIISFSGWVTFLYHYNLFLDGFVLYPLILWSIEKFYSKRWFVFPFLIGALGIIHYYMLYMFIPFIIVYSVMRFFVLKAEPKMNDFFKDMLMLFILGIVGIGLSAIILFPSINIVLNMPRLATQTNLFETIGKLQVFRYFSTLFTPTVEWHNPTYFISLEKDLGYGWGGGISVFSFYLFPLIISNVLFLTQKTLKKSLLLTYGVLFFFASFTVFYRLFQGTIDVRWFYMFLFLNVYAVVFILKEMVETGIKKRRVIVNWIINLLVLFSLYFITSSRAYANVEQIELLKKIVIVALLFMSSYSILLYFNRLKYLVFLVALEAVFSFMLPLYTNPPLQYEQFTEQYQKELASTKALESIQENDEGYYRIIRNTIAGFNLNEPFANHYKGVTFYESLYNFETTEFISRFTDKWLLPYLHGRFNTNFITSVKYYLQEDTSIEAPFGFELQSTVDGTNIFQNKYPISLGYSLVETINSDFFKTLPLDIQDQLWLNTVVLDQSTNQNYELLIQNNYVGSTGEAEYLYLSNYEVEKLNGAVITIVNNGTPYLTMSRHFQDEVKMEYHYQYNYFQIYNAYDQDFSAFELNATNPYGPSYNVDVFVTSDLSDYDAWYQQLNQFYNVKIKQDKVSADIDISNMDEWIVTSIPYDIGWEVTVDGIKHSYDKVNLGFIGFKAPVGSHHITFSYSPPYFKLGAIVSIISTFIIVCICLLKNRFYPFKDNK